MLYPDVILYRLEKLIFAPLVNPEMLWILFPIALSLLIMEFYYTRHPDSLGWDTAFSNSLVLIFVSVDIIRNISQRYSFFFEAERTVMLIAFMLFTGFALSFMNFTKRWGPHSAFKFSKPILIYFFAYVSVILVYSVNIPTDWNTIAAAAILFFIVYFVVKTMAMFIPEHKEHPTYLRKSYQQGKIKS